MVLGDVTEIDLADRHVVRFAVDVGGSHLVICLDDEMMRWVWEGMIRDSYTLGVCYCQLQLNRGIVDVSWRLLISQVIVEVW